MFNEELCKIYTPEIISELRKVASVYESENRKVLVALSRKHKESVIPMALYMDNPTI